MQRTRPLTFDRLRECPSMWWLGLPAGLGVAKSLVGEVK